MLHSFRSAVPSGSVKIPSPQPHVHASLFANPSTHQTQKQKHVHFQRRSSLPSVTPPESFLPAPTLGLSSPLLRRRQQAGLYSKGTPEDLRAASTPHINLHRSSLMGPYGGIVPEGFCQAVNSLQRIALGEAARGQGPPQESLFLGRSMRSMTLDRHAHAPSQPRLSMGLNGISSSNCAPSSAALL